ncbi:hypothetical protein GTY54_18555, partial [Streptomyces sp. SID625]|nr:hypothetical protein [Streptomyces sp. SID625]
MQVVAYAQVADGVAVAALVHRGVTGELDHDVGHDRQVVDRLAGAPPGGEAAVLPGMLCAALVQQAAGLPPCRCRQRCRPRDEPQPACRVVAWPSSSVTGAATRPVTEAT